MASTTSAWSFWSLVPFFESLLYAHQFDQMIGHSHENDIFESPTSTSFIWTRVYVVMCALGETEFNSVVWNWMELDCFGTCLIIRLTWDLLVILCFFSLFIEIYIAQWTRSLMFGYGCLFYMNENIDFDDRENLTFNFIDIEGRSHTTTLHFLKTNWSNNFAVHADRETLYKFNPWQRLPLPICSDGILQTKFMDKSNMFQLSNAIVGFVACFGTGPTIARFRVWKKNTTNFLIENYHCGSTCRNWLGQPLAQQHIACLDWMCCSL